MAEYGYKKNKTEGATYIGKVAKKKALEKGLEKKKKSVMTPTLEERVDRASRSYR